MFRRKYPDDFVGLRFSETPGVLLEDEGTKISGKEKGSCNSSTRSVSLTSILGNVSSLLFFGVLD